MVFSQQIPTLIPLLTNALLEMVNAFVDRIAYVD